MGLKDEISCSVFVRSSLSQNCTGVWLAFGNKVALFDFTSTSLVMKLADASRHHDLLNDLGDQADVLNEIAVSSTHIAYSSDSGIVGVLDLNTGTQKEMRTRHNGIAGSVSFIPDRPRELVTGGYDHQLIHFDFSQGSVLSKSDFDSLTSVDPPAGSTSRMSLSPPFVTSLAVSSSGIVAAGAANGRLWVGFGGAKESAGEFSDSPEGAKKRSSKKRARYWEGLKAQDQSTWLEAATGPIVAISFLGFSPTIIACSLGGKITALQSVSVAAQERRQGYQWRLEERWTLSTSNVKKVNCMKCKRTSDDGVGKDYCVVAGLSSTGAGCVEVFGLPPA